MRAAYLQGMGQAPAIIGLPAFPRVGAGQVLVAMKRAPINPADLLMIDGGYAFAADAPQIIGAEGVGEVQEIGAGVTGLQTGDRVLPLSRGNWATHRLLDATDVVRVSPELTIDQAATLRINPATALRLLSLAPLRAGDWVVQNAAGSMVAIWVRGIAARRGIGVIDLVRAGGSRPDSSRVVTDDEDAITAVRALTGGGTVKLAVDCVAGAASGRLAAMLAPDATLAVFGHLSGEPCSIPSLLLTGKGLTVLGFSLRPAEAADTHDGLQGIYDELSALALAVDLQPTVAAVVPLDEMPDALALVRQCHLQGKVMIALGDG